MKMQNKICTILLALLTIISQMFYLSLVELSASAEAVNCNIPSIEDDFADDTVLIVFDNPTSLDFSDYSKYNFADIEYESVRSLSTATSNKIKAAMDNIAYNTAEAVGFQPYSGIKPSDFKEVVCIKLKNKGKENVIKTIKTLSNQKGIAYVGPDYYLDVCSAETDTTAYPNDPYASGTWAIGRLELSKAWEITRGSSSIMVGVIDSGIMGNHNDLKNNIDINKSRDCTVSLKVSGGLDDSLGHGTAVAGIIGAVGNNGIGICGTCPQVKLVSLKVQDAAGKMKSSYVADAIDYAEENNIPVLNLSVSWSTKKGNMSNYDESLYQTIMNYSGLLVCSAGNVNADNDFYTSYPSCYELNNIITIGAHTISNEIWINNDDTTKGSNYGEISVDLFAPGEHIYTTNNQGSYEFSYAGTSLAAPYVSGVAALMLSVNPNLTAVQLKDIITRTVDVVPALENYCVSGGRLNAYKAVRTAQMYRFAENTTYTTLPETDTLYHQAHGVLYDACSECSCRTDDYSCDECGICEPCEDCHIYFTELHDYRYIATTSLNTHNVVCLDCGYSGTFLHYWIDNGTTYTCYYCNMSTTSPPILSVLSSTDPEFEAYLASLSDEELEVFIASLPEDQVERVTALLPSDDEQLTE